MILNSKDYQLSALSLTAAVRFREWVREQVLREAKERIALLADIFDPSERRGIIQNALAMIDSGQAEKVMTETPEGKRMIVYLCLLPKHPEITLDQAGDLVPRFADNADVLDKMLDTANGFKEVNATEPSTPASASRTTIDLTALPPEEARRRIFDGMCKTNGLTPQGLVDLPIAAAEALYFKELGKPIAQHFDRLRFKAYLLDYAAKNPIAEVPLSEMPSNVKEAVDLLNAKIPPTMDGTIKMEKSPIIGEPNAVNAA